MNSRVSISSQQNRFYDSESIDDQDLTLEQDHNAQVQADIINNHFGSGLLPDTLIQKVLFDSSLVVGLLDGIALSSQDDPTDNSLGNQLEIELSGSAAAGRRSIKIAIIGLDFNSNMQYDTFSFSRNEKKLTTKHYTKILLIVVNDLLGAVGRSFNLGGKIVIREAKSLYLSKDTKMIAQDVQPNLIFRDMFVSGFATLSSFLTTSLPTFNIDNLNITTGYKQLRSLNINDVASQIGQKFIAKTNNIQKISLLLSVVNNTTPSDLGWTGDLVISIYPLQSVVENPTDIVPELAIDFDPSNIPLAQLSFNYDTLSNTGIVLDGTPQPVDFVFSNTPVANGSVIVPGKFYAVTLRRSGSADKCIIQTPVGNNLVSDAMVTLFDGSAWINIPEEDLWFQVWTDAAKVSDGQAYDVGNGIVVPKIKLDETTATNIDYSLDKLSFVRNNTYYANLQANVEESNQVQDERTGNPVFSKKQFVPAASLVTATELTNLQKNSNPLLLGSIADKNIKSFDAGTALFDGYFHAFTFVKDEALIKIIDDPTDPRYDLKITELVAKFLDGSFSDAKIVPNIAKPSLIYKIASAELDSMIYGDLNGDGVVDETDLILAQSYINYDLRSIPDLTTYQNYINVFKDDSPLSYIVTDGVTTFLSNIDGILVPNPSDPTLANFNSVAVDFNLVPSLGSKKIVITSANPGNNGTFSIVGLTDLHNITIQKVYLTGDRISEILRADIDGDFKITFGDTLYISNYVNKVAPFPSSLSPSNRIGTKFDTLRIKLEQLIDRNDDGYMSSSLGRDGYLHIIQDIPELDNAVFGTGFIGTNLLTSPVKFNITKRLNWHEEAITVVPAIRSVLSSFIQNTGAVDNSCSLVGLEKDLFPIPAEFDPGVSDIFIPNNLMLAFGGEIKRPDGYFYKVDFEIGTIVFEVPAIAFPEEKTINVFSDFIYDYNSNGITRLGLEAMRFADCSFVKADALIKNQLRLSVAAQSFSPHLDGYDGYEVAKIIADGKIGVHMDYGSGLLTFNFGHLYEDAVLQTLNTKIEITVYIKKAGFNNKPVYFNSVKAQNLLGLSGPPFIGGGGPTPAPSIFSVEDIVIVAGTQSTANTIYTSIGTIDFDPTKYPDPKSITFEVALETTSGLDGYVRLYNSTLGSTVVDSVLHTTSSTSVILTSVPLTLLNSNNVYEVHIKLTGIPGPGDVITCKIARLILAFS